MLNYDPEDSDLHNGQLRSSNIKRVHIRCQPSESLLCSIRPTQCMLAPIVTRSASSHLPDECVDFDAVNVVELLQSLLDLPLVRRNIDDEHERVILLDLLHGALGVQRVHDDFVVIQAGLMVDGLARVFGRPRQLQRLRSMESRRKTDFAGFVRVDLYRPSEMGF